MRLVNARAFLCQHHAAIFDRLIFNAYDAIHHWSAGSRKMICWTCKDFKSLRSLSCSSLSLWKKKYTLSFNLLEEVKAALSLCFGIIISACNITLCNKFWKPFDFVLRSAASVWRSLAISLPYTGCFCRIWLSKNRNGDQNTLLINLRCVICPMLVRDATRRAAEVRGHKAFRTVPGIRRLIYALLRQICIKLTDLLRC